MARPSKFKFDIEERFVGGLQLRPNGFIAVLKPSARVHLFTQSTGPLCLRPTDGFYGALDFIKYVYHKEIKHIARSAGDRYFSLEFVPVNAQTISIAATNLTQAAIRNRDNKPDTGWYTMLPSCHHGLCQCCWRISRCLLADATVRQQAMACDEHV
jgi:hypothetical protein